MTLIAQISDLHVRPRGAPACRVVESNMLAERAVAAVNALDPQPDFVIVTGDLTDKAQPNEYAMGREILDRLRSPYAVIAGNHDSSAELKRCFADRDWARQMDGDSVQFSIRVSNVRLVGLNSAVEEQSHGELSQEELSWLATVLEEDQTVPTVIAVHHPPIVTGVVHMDQINLRNAEELGRVLSRHDNIVRVICGHDHRPIVAPFAGTIVTVAPATAHQVVLDMRPDGPSAFNFEPPAYFLHKYSPQNGLVTHMAYVESFPGPYPFSPEPTISWQ